MHLLSAKMLEVQVHGEVLGVLSDPGGRVDLLQSSQLPLNSSLSRQQRPLIIARLEPKVHEGQRVVGLNVEPVQGAFPSLQRPRLGPHGLGHLLLQILEACLDLVHQVLADVVELGHHRALLK